jgi:hypothetical protein
MPYYGILIKGKQPKSKKQVRFCRPEDVVVLGTSMFDPHIKPGEGVMSILQLPYGTYHWKGPDPYFSPKFGGEIVVSEKGVTIS